MIPELSSDIGRVMRIPDQLDVPVTKRVMRLIDTSAMQRLRHVSQLGLVARVYPGATHSRFEHSLGVYALAVRVLQRLIGAEQELFSTGDEESCEAFLVAALLHDIAHWPYCHPMEDMQLGWVPEHEALARQLICDSELTTAITEDWAVTPDSVAEFLAPTRPCTDNVLSVLRSALNGPVDIDKMDYLQRDSLHAGVPYGRNFDLARLISSMCADMAANRLAITGKGKTAAEMLVFSRYVMFSEVYWHHAVRSGTAMLQRLVFENESRLQEASSNGKSWLSSVESTFHDQLADVSAGTPTEGLCNAIVGRKRALYKRFGEFNFGEAPDVHTALRPIAYSSLVNVATELAGRLSSHLQVPLSPTDVLLDAPPMQREVQFRLNVIDGGESMPLGEISPVVKALATEQFDAFVKKVRVFVSPEVGRLPPVDPAQLRKMLLDSISDG